MTLLKRIRENANANPDKIGLINLNDDIKLTLQEVDIFSDRLASYILNNLPNDKSPLVVYGHKSPYMIVVFLACAKSGHPYCPIDISNPTERVIDIIRSSEPDCIFLLEELDLKNDYNFIKKDEIIKICNETDAVIKQDILEPDADDVFYILFTSGSTGKPKGVEITYSNLNNFLAWSSELTKRYLGDKDTIFLNQAPFSFDLSVMDLYTSIYMGGTLCMLDKATQMTYSKLMNALEKSNITAWVSTPSFAEMCLIDKKFSAELLPNMKIFLFCGEILTNHIALQLIKRFPNANIINTYGPTESTVAVTEQLITKELCENGKPLPIGIAKAGTKIMICDDKLKEQPNGEEGEIIISGNTLAKGYFKNQQDTEKAFTTPYINGKFERVYKTGDKGYFDKNGILHYKGRIDKQIKLNGYRIEIGDIENNLKKLEHISNAVVIPKYIDDKVKSLIGFITVDNNIRGDRQDIKNIKSMLKELIPEYMVPKKIIVIDSMPMNTNGKIDRNELGRLI